VFNFSQRLISDKEKEILSKGLNFAIPPNKLDRCAFFAPFERLHRKLKDEQISSSSGYYPTLVKTKLKDIALSGHRSYSIVNRGDGLETH
jgi:hypothetical protein